MNGFVATTDFSRKNAGAAGKPVTIAYLILVHRYADQFKRLFAAIHDPANHYVVHVDARSADSLADEISAFLQSYPNASMLPQREARWGGYSLVDAELRGMAHLLAIDPDWTHFINLSGQDFPLRTQREIAAFLSDHPDHEYIHMLDQQKTRPDTMHRVREYCFEMFGRIIRTPLRRAFLTGVTPYIGTQWKIVSRAFCDYACHDRGADRFKRFYKHSFIADEGFFQTLMMGGAPHGMIVANDMRMIDWVPDGDIKLRPRTFTSIDAQALLASDNLFARKFDLLIDASIFDVIEQRLASSRAAASAMARSNLPGHAQALPPKRKRQLVGVDLPEPFISG